LRSSSVRSASLSGVSAVSVTTSRVITSSTRVHVADARRADGGGGGEGADAAAATRAQRCDARSRRPRPGARSRGASAAAAGEHVASIVGDTAQEAKGRGGAEGCEMC
jgi:hypothetical protein